MNEPPSIKIKHILPTGEFDEDEYILKSVAEAALDERDAELSILRHRLDILTEALQDIADFFGNDESVARDIAEKALRLK